MRQFRSIVEVVGAKGVGPSRVLSHPSTPKADAFTSFATPRYGSYVLPVRARDHESRALHPTQGQAGSQAGLASRRSGFSLRRRHLSFLTFGFQAGAIPGLNAVRGDFARTDIGNHCRTPVTQGAGRQGHIRRPDVASPPASERLTRDAKQPGCVRRFDHFFLHRSPRVNNSIAVQKTDNPTEIKKPEPWRCSRHQFGLSLV
jgi:hypothetical protein